MLYKCWLIFRQEQSGMSSRVTAQLASLGLHSLPDWLHLEPFSFINANPALCACIHKAYGIRYKVCATPTCTVNTTTTTPTCTAYCSFSRTSFSIHARRKCQRNWIAGCNFRCIQLDDDDNDDYKAVSRIREPAAGPTWLVVVPWKIEKQLNAAGALWQPIRVGYLKLKARLERITGEQEEAGGSGEEAPGPATAADTG